MTERGDTHDDTQVRPPTGEPPAVSPEEGAEAVSEGAREAVDPAPASGAVETPAPAIDESAATPDRQGPGQTVAGTVDERPELLVAGAFVGGLVLALILRRAAGD